MRCFFRHYHRRPPAGYPCLKTLDAGYTTVRNAGASDWNDVGLSQAIAAGKVLGPRIILVA